MNLKLLRRAAAEYFIEGFLSAETRRRLDQALPEERIDVLEAMQPLRTVPEGCFTWIAHLIWLEQVLEIVPVPLTASEVEGLLVLKQERLRFQAEHPPCPKCGMPNEEHAIRCRECMAELNLG